MTNTEERMNPLHFGSDVRIRISPKIWIWIPKPGCIFAWDVGLGTVYL